MNQALRNAIYTTGKTVTGLSASNFRFVKVPEGTNLPYVVFNEVASPTDWDSATKFETCHVQFSCYSDVLTEIETFADNIKSKFDFGKDNLTVTGYTVVKCVREFEIGPRQNDKTWEFIIQYQIEISITR